MVNRHSLVSFLLHSIFLLKTFFMLYYHFFQYGTTNKYLWNTPLKKRIQKKGESIMNRIADSGIKTTEVPIDSHYFPSIRGYLTLHHPILIPLFFVIFSTNLYINDLSISLVAMTLSTGMYWKLNQLIFQKSNLVCRFERCCKLWRYLHRPRCDKGKAYSCRWNCI